MSVIVKVSIKEDADNEKIVGLLRRILSWGWCRVYIGNTVEVEVDDWIGKDLKEYSDIISWIRVNDGEREIPVSPEDLWMVLENVLKMEKVKEKYEKYKKILDILTTEKVAEAIRESTREIVEEHAKELAEKEINKILDELEIPYYDP